MVLRFKSGVFYTYNNSSEEKIMKLVGHVEVTKGYEHWKKIFLSSFHALLMNAISCNFKHFNFKY